MIKHVTKNVRFSWESMEKLMEFKCEQIHKVHERTNTFCFTSPLVLLVWIAVLIVST